MRTTLRQLGLSQSLFQEVFAWLPNVRVVTIIDLPRIAIIDGRRRLQMVGVPVASSLLLRITPSKAPTERLIALDDMNRHRSIDTSK